MPNAQIALDSNFVQVPYIIVDIGGFKFGNVSKHILGNQYEIEFPNFIQDMTVKKINGEVAQYTINLVYQISPGDDPNLIDKVFGQVSDNREIEISYGDYNSEHTQFRNEKAIITNITQNIQNSQSKITYSISATGNSFSLTANKFDFPSMVAKPSDIIKDLFRNNSQYELQTMFPGVKGNFSQLFKGTDKAVQLEAKHNTDVVSYMNYLVSCMQPYTSSKTGLSDTYYQMVIHDEKTNSKGPYVEVVEIMKGDNSQYYDNKQNSYFQSNMYVIHIGTPDDNFVTDFSVNTNQEFGILYNHSSVSKPNNFTYSIDQYGNMSTTFAPSISKSYKLDVMSDDKQWWSQMVNFPIQASVRLKGLSKPVLLASYVYLDVSFYGVPHYTSGTYIITSQTDSISSSGCQTTLELTKISE